jgi:plasmid maintenance system antidote protein VapI
MGMKAKLDASDLEEVLRRAIRGSGLTRYAVAKGAELNTSQLLRFVAGERSLTLPAATKLARFLGLGLVSLGFPSLRESGAQYEAMNERARRRNKEPMKIGRGIRFPARPGKAR